MGSERRERIRVVQPQVAVAIGIADAQHYLASEGAVGIHQVGQPLIIDFWLDGVFHLFLTGGQRKKRKDKKEDRSFHGAKLQINFYLCSPISAEMETLC